MSTPNSLFILKSLYFHWQSYVHLEKLISLANSMTGHGFRHIEPTTSQNQVPKITLLSQGWS